METFGGLGDSTARFIKTLGAKIATRIEDIKVSVSASAPRHYRSNRLLCLCYGDFATTSMELRYHLEAFNFLNLYIPFVSFFLRPYLFLLFIDVFETFYFKFILFDMSCFIFRECCSLVP